MLTATYVLLTLSIEQKKERHFIARLLQYVQSIARRPQEIDPVFIESQLKELTTFAETRHQRKVEVCLMPAVRAADASCGALMNDLESLSRLGGAMLNAVHKCLRRAMRRSASQGKFLIKRCTACGEPHYFPRSICPFCFSDKTVWEESSGEGEIYTFSLMRKSATGPYAIGWVTLKEGPSLMTNFVDCDLHKLKIGQKVKVVFKPTDGLPLPFFAPVG